MKSHRSTCILRIAELAEDETLRSGVIWALCQHQETAQLSLVVQAVLELRDALADEAGAQEKLDELERSSTRG